MDRLLDGRQKNAILSFWLKKLLDFTETLYIFVKSLGLYHSAGLWMPIRIGGGDHEEKWPKYRHNCIAGINERNWEENE